MLRYFLAIPLPDDIKDRLVVMQPPAVPGIRLIGRQELHLTLHFLGELDPPSDGAVRKALATVKTNAFKINIKGLGRFPSEGQPQVLWSGIESSPSLLALHHATGIALSEAICFQLEQRPYSPHITLARLNGDVTSSFIEHYLEKTKGFQVQSVLLNKLALYSSVFVNGIPHYREEAVFHFL